MKKSFSPTTKPYDRIRKVNTLLLSEINQILLKDGFFSSFTEKDDRIISLTRVETARDLRNATVYFLVIPEKYKATVGEALNKRASKINRLLGKKLNIKNKPRLEFLYDSGQGNAFAVEAILDEEARKKIA